MRPLWWSRSLDIGLCDRLLRPNVDGSPTFINGEAHFTHGVAYCFSFSGRGVYI